MIPIAIFTFILYFIAGYFSFNYMRFEKNNFKYFLNYLIFGLGLCFFILGEKHVSIFAGVELLGLSSLFLISFYNEREQPVKNALYVVYFYKFADFILLISLLLTYKYHQNLVLYGIITVACIKSGAFPFSTWPSKAMEGPTSSSGIFYGSLALNIGPILILKFENEILTHPMAIYYLCTAGIFTFIYAAIQARIQTDVKSSLGYASLSQIGLIFIELGLNFPNLAIVHMFLNSYLKCYQFLSAPSLITDYHYLPYDGVSIFSKNGIHLENILPKSIKKKLYYLSLHHFHLDNLFSFISNGLNYLTKNKIFFIMGIIVSLLLGNITLMLLFSAIGMLKEKNIHYFSAYFLIYNIFTCYLDYNNNISHYLVFIGLLLTFVFIIVIYKFPKQKILIIIMMLQFANFPYLIESNLNEELLDYFIHHNNFKEMILYGLSNTFFNIGLYHFIFYSIYLKKEQYNEARFSPKIS